MLLQHVGLVFGADEWDQVLFCRFIIEEQEKESESSILVGCFLFRSLGFSISNR